MSFQQRRACCRAIARHGATTTAFIHCVHLALFFATRPGLGRDGGLRACVLAHAGTAIPLLLRQNAPRLTTAASPFISTGIFSSITLDHFFSIRSVIFIYINIHVNLFFNCPKETINIHPKHHMDALIASDLAQAERVGLLAIRASAQGAHLPERLQEHGHNLLRGEGPAHVARWAQHQPTA